ncbi:MAG: PASTA domain-containing protein [Eubacteriales bacterium]
MKRAPDVTGLDLESALCELKEAGWEVELKFTLPVKGNPEGAPRVVCFSRGYLNKGVLTVVFEDKGKGGGTVGVQDYR